MKNNKPDKNNHQPIDHPKISVAITAYDEEESIYEAVRDFLSCPGVVEVIVVDNNSRDKTRERAEEAGARVVLEKKQGYGFACMRGLREALKNQEANIVVLAEGDGTFRGNDMKKLVPYLDNVDLVIGNRMTYQLVDENSQQDFFFAWGNWFLAKVIQLKYAHWKFLGRTRLMDVGCTFRAIRKEALERIMDKLYIGKDYFSPHMILVALDSGLSVIEVPVTFKKRIGISKGASLNKFRATRVGLQMLFHILTYRGKK